MLSQLTTAEHTHELLAFARGAALPTGGFGYLRSDGRVDTSVAVSTLITARMTYCMSIASVLASSPEGEAVRLRDEGAGIAEAAQLAEHGIRALSTLLRDTRNGGWVVDLGDEPDASDKRAYQTAFVVLAASTASRAHVPGAERLLVDVLSAVETHFWSERYGALIESWNADWTVREPYWGANANMHGVEALLAAHGATGDPLWLARATRIADTFIQQRARANNWMLAEHFADDWTPLPDYNIERPDDQFRPFGVTIGHLFEWSRLLLELGAAYPAGAAPAWLRECAEGLYATARRIGWSVDGAEGFVYTVDWVGEPVVRERLHWVVAEAIGAAATLHSVTGQESYLVDLRSWQSYAARYLLDREQGSWYHTLDAKNRPTDAVWSGKPDVYHALQAVLLGDLPVGPTLFDRLVTLSRNE